MTRHCTPNPPAAGLRRGLMLLVMTVLLMAGCSSDPQKKNGQGGPETVYRDGIAALSTGNLAEAEKRFRILSERFPDHARVPQSRLELAYGQFRQHQYPASLTTVEDYLHNYPQHSAQAYGYYLRALDAFELARQDLGSPNVPLPDASGHVQQAISYIDELTQRHPGSQYQSDADKRRRYLSDQLIRLGLEYAKQQVTEGNFPNAIRQAEQIIAANPDPAIVQQAETVRRMARSQLQNKARQTVTAPREQAPDSAAAAATPDTPAVATPAASTTTGPETRVDTATTAPINELETRPASPAQHAATPGEQWLLEQRPARYTLQLLTLSDEHAVQRFIAEHHLGKKAVYYRKNINGARVYSLTYGSYDGPKAARAAINELPDAVRRNQPWVIQLDAVQQAIRAGQTSR
ncbi:MAG: outer membrane protein assembly factor BamD [Gammaproteobacteria bacterium]|nr:outer membrane protein assembly factor BamD [Gammaproteobacteria bacterium]